MVRELKENDSVQTLERQERLETGLLFFRIPGLRDDFFKRGFTIAFLKRPEKGPELRKSLMMM